MLKKSDSKNIVKMGKMLNRLIKWYLFPATPQSRARERALKEYKRFFPEMIERYERAESITDGDRTMVRWTINDYRELYIEAEESDRANVTLGQANRFDDANIQAQIVRLENALRRFD